MKKQHNIVITLAACSIHTCTVPPVAEGSVSLISSVVNGRLNFALTATIDWVSWLHDSTTPSVRLLVVLRSNLTQQTLNQCKVTRTIVIQNIVITQVAGERKRGRGGRKTGRGGKREGRERARSSYFLLYKNNHALQDAVSLNNFFQCFPGCYLTKCSINLLCCNLQDAVLLNESGSIECTKCI